MLWPPHGVDTPQPPLETSVAAAGQATEAAEPKAAAAWAAAVEVGRAAVATVEVMVEDVMVAAAAWGAARLPLAARH